MSADLKCWGILNLSKLHISQFLQHLQEQTKGIRDLQRLCDPTICSRSYAPFTLDEGANTMSCKGQKLKNLQVVSVPLSSFVLSPSFLQSCLRAVWEFPKFEDTHSHTAEFYFLLHLLSFTVVHCIVMINQSIVMAVVNCQILPQSEYSHTWAW